MTPCAAPWSFHASHLHLELQSVRRCWGKQASHFFSLICKYWKRTAASSGEYPTCNLRWDQDLFFLIKIFFSICCLFFFFLFVHSNSNSSFNTIYLQISDLVCAQLSGFSGLILCEWSAAGLIVGWLIQGCLSWDSPSLHLRFSHFLYLQKTSLSLSTQWQESERQGYMQDLLRSRLRNGALSFHQILFTRPSQI